MHEISNLHTITNRQAIPNGSTLGVGAGERGTTMGAGGVS